MNVVLTVVSILVGFFAFDALLAWIWGAFGHKALHIGFYDNRPLRRRYPKLLPRNVMFLFWLGVILLWFGWGFEHFLWHAGWPIWLAGIIGGCFTRATLVLGEYSDQLRYPQRYKTERTDHG